MVARVHLLPFGRTEEATVERPGDYLCGEDVERVLRRLDPGVGPVTDVQRGYARALDDVAYALEISKASPDEKAPPAHLGAGLGESAGQVGNDPPPPEPAHSSTAGGTAAAVPSGPSGRVDGGVRTLSDAPPAVGGLAGRVSADSVVRRRLADVAREVVEELDPDSDNARAGEAYCDEVEGIVNEALIDAVFDTVRDLPSFADWCAERDVAEGADLDRDRAVGL